MTSRTADLLNAALLAVAVGALFAFNYAVDPFDLNRRVDLGLEKERVSYTLSYWDWLVAKYTNEPAPHLVLGDSRGLKLPAERRAALAGEPAVNLSYGGGTLADMLATFAFATERGGVRTVTMAFGFNLLDATNTLDRTTPAVEASRDPVRYYFSPFTTQASLKVLWANAGGAAPSEAPPMEKDAFWAYQLDVTTTNNYHRYEYPEAWLEKLAAIGAWCRDHRVDLRFVYVPTHVDLQRRVDDFGLRADYERSKVDLAAIAPLYDYDYPNALTEDRARFPDPYHFTEADGERILDEVWGGEPWLARRSGPR